MASYSDRIPWVHSPVQPRRKGRREGRGRERGREVTEGGEVGGRKASK